MCVRVCVCVCAWGVCGLCMGRASVMASQELPVREGWDECGGVENLVGTDRCVCVCVCVYVCVRVCVRVCVSILSMLFQSIVHMFFIKNGWGK